MVEPFIPEECPEYLAHFMRSTGTRLFDIEEKLDRLIDGPNPKKKGSGKAVVKSDDGKAITFKWLVEKLLVPAMWIAAGYVLRGG